MTTEMERLKEFYDAYKDMGKALAGTDYKKAQARFLTAMQEVRRFYND